MTSEPRNGQNAAGAADRERAERAAERAERAAEQADRRARDIDRLGRWIVRLAVALFLAIMALSVAALDGRIDELSRDVSRMQGQLANEAQVQQAYDAAIADAAVAKPSEISNALTPIQMGAPVLTVTWTSWKGYDEAIGSAMNLSRDVWITLVPQLAEFCSKLEGDVDLNLRLEQRLGLPPYSQRTKVVEMWVEPNDLFRPCPDPEIDDSHCALNFPPGTDVEHIKWIDNRRKTSYSGDTPYPWTRLGYTYDWARSPDNRFRAGASYAVPAVTRASPEAMGLSEYVIRKGATVRVKSVDSTGNYCQR